VRSAPPSRSRSRRLAPTCRGSRGTAKLDDDGNWELNGQKMWVTNGLGSSVVFVLMKNDTKAEPPYKGMTCFITEKEPWKEVNEGKFAGLTVPPKIKKMGYKGVESTELVYDGYKCPPDRVLGGPDGVGQGFKQMMDALEVGPRQRRRARRRHRPAGARAGAQIQPGAEKPSASRSPSTRRSRSSSPTWRRGSRRPPGHPQSGADEGRRRALRSRGRHGQAPRLGDGEGKRRGRLPHPRWLRLTRRSTRSSASTATPRSS